MKTKFELIVDVDFNHPAIKEGFENRLTQGYTVEQINKLVVDALTEELMETLKEYSEEFLSYTLEVK